MKTLEEVKKLAGTRPNKTVAIACPEDHEVLEAISEASNLDLCNFILFGDQNEIKLVADEVEGFKLGAYKVIHCDTKEDACMKAVKAVSSGDADVLMKGLVDTSVILKKVLDREFGLRTGNVLSHVMIIDLPKFNRLLFLSDGAMNITPTVEQLKQITTSTVTLARSLQITRPKVACISAIEKVNQKMPSSEIGRKLQEMNENGEIVNCDVCGPLAIDLALDEEAAAVKNINHPVAGNADVLIVPYIEVGNALYKGWMFGCEHVKSAGIIMGAKAPIVLTSRADSKESKVYSIALSVLMDQ
ncbi:phosphate acyltransferase [Haloplasma contractile]|uniref:Phosphate butyryltransferase protein n=1 Tax=Haloplasma contractile SSD-17B TaxID=1033810 RepID=U2E902_9MOLU|nr:phosphate acyltransferase [Haloplasma contractile]ERJ11623.1 Phosphate butyryltransferase protein [Haloplasma contractile SSD-17B]